MKKNIPHNCPTLGKEEILASQRVLKSLSLSEGENISLFENEVCHFLKLPQGHAVAVSSGSAALFLALMALNAKNKKVTFPSYVCSSVKHAVQLANAREHIIDTSKNTPHPNLDIFLKSESQILILPHLYGIPCDFKSLKGKLIIEDCAQALGASIRKQPVGTLGELGIFSFYATKLITSAGQGGMVVSKNKKHIQWIKDFIYFDCKNDSKFRFNFQMTEVQAAVGRVQLKRLPQFLKKREAIFNAYSSLGIPLLGNEVDSKEIKAVRYRAVWKTTQAKRIQKKLLEKGIKSIIPIEHRELLGDKTKFKEAQNLCQNTLSLPLYPSLKEQELNYILMTLRTLMDGRNSI